MAAARLPIPGEDKGTWGDILNTFLSVEHNSDGTLKPNGTLAVKANELDVVHKTGNETIAGSKNFTNSPTVPTPTGSNDVANKEYVDSLIDLGRPPELATVATTGSYDDLSDQPTFSAVASSGSYTDLTNTPAIPDGSNIVHLDGTQTITGAKNFTGGVTISGQAAVASDDTRLSNTRTPSDDSVSTAKLRDGSITEPKLAISNSPTLGYSIGWSGSNLEWQAPLVIPVESVNSQTGIITLDKDDIGLGNVDNTSDLNKPMSTATKEYVDVQTAQSQNLVIGTSAPTPPTGASVLWLDTSGGNMTLNLVTGD